MATLRQKETTISVFILLCFRILVKQIDKKKLSMFVPGLMKPVTRHLLLVEEEGKDHRFYVVLNKGIK